MSIDKIAALTRGDTETVASMKERLEEAASRPVRTEWDDTYKRYVLVIDGIKGDAKSLQSEARCEQTITGVRWVLSGSLAKTLDRFVQDRLGRAQPEQEGDGTHPNQMGPWL